MFAGMVKKKKQRLRNNADTFILPLIANRYIPLIPNYVAIDAIA